jgi:starvation-inducible DNA-binding protein
MKEKKTTAPVIDTGIAEKDRAKIADGLARLLADNFTLYLKTHNFHWNVTGPMFNTLHLMFETQYNDLWMSLDLIAERIRSLGEYAPFGAEIGAKSEVPGDKGVPNAETMIANLVDGNELLARSARTALKAAEEAGDQATADLMTQRVAIAEKTAWMLRASAG